MCLLQLLLGAVDAGDSARREVGMLMELAVAPEQDVESQIDRILRSEELRGSEVLRRLLRFLADKSASGEADDLI